VNYPQIPHQFRAAAVAMDMLAVEPGRRSGVAGVLKAKPGPGIDWMRERECRCSKGPIP
jgi:hypothetical protein